MLRLSESAILNCITIFVSGVAIGISIAVIVLK